jgi:hypothetical protein
VTPKPLPGETLREKIEAHLRAAGWEPIPRMVEGWTDGRSVFTLEGAARCQWTREERAREAARNLSKRARTFDWTEEESA